MTTESTPKKARRGFSAMAPEKQRAIASKGGRASHAPGKGGHEWSSAEAKEAGRKGGLAARARKNAAPMPAVYDPKHYPEGASAADAHLARKGE